MLRDAGVCFMQRQRCKDLKCQYAAKHFKGYGMLGKTLVREARRAAVPPVQNTFAMPRGAFFAVIGFEKFVFGEVDIPVLRQLL